MTEKRFFILTDDEYDIRPCIRDRTFKIEDIYGDYKYDDLDEICNEFNCLNDENEQLKHDATILIQANQDYRKENEELKQQNDFLTTQLAELSTYMMALGYDIELEFEDGRVIKLNEELKGDV